MPKPRPVRSEYLRVRLAPAEMEAATKAAAAIERLFGLPFSVSDFVRAAIADYAKVQLAEAAKIDDERKAKRAAARR